MASLQHPLIIGEGEMADAIRAHDWAATSLGPIEAWSQTLLVSVQLMLLSPIGISLYWGPDFVLLYNDSYRVFVGPRHPAALGQTGGEVWAEAWQIIGPQVQAALERGESTHGRRTLVPIERAGRLEDFFWNYTFSPIYEGAERAGVHNICQNVTADVLVQRSLSESEARANRIFESIGDAVIVTDTETRVTRMNPVAEELTGWSFDEARGRPLSTVFHIIEESARNLQENPADKVKRLNTVVGLANHTLLVRRDGSEIAIDDSGSPIRDEQGAMTGIVVIFRNVDERRKAELHGDAMHREVERGYAQLRAIYDSSSMALALIDPKTFVYMRANRKLAEILGQSVDQVVGSSVFDLAGNVPRLKELLENVAGGTPVIGELLEGELTTTPGVRRFFHVDYVPILATDGTVERIAAASVEITALKQTEEALIQSEKLSAVGRLAASIAHEINNPLESVTNLLYLAQRSTLVDEIQDYLNTAEHELQRVSQIANQTLRFHKQATRPTSVNCYELFDSVLVIFHGRLANSKITIEKRKRCNRPVLCFEGEIRQLISNLIGNAVDAMHPSGGRLLLRSRCATRWSKGDQGLVLTVADTGPGMSAETIEKIFMPFFTTKGFAGTGLGLWVSQEIAQRHHGRLVVRSAQGALAHGTVFTLFLPFAAVTRMETGAS